MPGPMPGPKANENHENWIPVLELAAQEVFELMLGTHLDVAPASTIVEDTPDITAMVGLAGGLCGVLTIQCSSRSAAEMASMMLGVEVERAAPQVWDALGEVCNMVAGNFKNKIAGMGEGFMLSVPTVITGADYNRHASCYSSTIQASFWFEGARITMALDFQ